MHAISLFCEDIREEKSGTVTIVGVLPDNLSIPSLPSLMPKLCIYTRIHIAPKSSQDQIVAKIRLSDGAEHIIGEADQGLIAKARQDGIDANVPIFGIILTAILSPFPVLSAGRLLVIVAAGDEEIISGQLNIQAASTS